MKAAAHQIIYTHGGGRLGNQIIRFVHWIAWVRASNADIEVLDLAFWPFARLFETWSEHPGCIFPIRKGRADWLAACLAASPKALRQMIESSNRLQRGAQLFGRWWPGWGVVKLDVSQSEMLDLDDPQTVLRLTHKSVTTCSGWRISSWRHVAEQEAELRTYFRPAPQFAARGAEFVDGLRANHDFLIGVFIRQSDYRTWDEGRFFFSTAQYVQWIRQLLDLHNDRRVAVVIASDERLDSASFVGLPCHFATGTFNRGGHWFESWVELSLCDVVVSPPSTFSATASFVGGLPLWPIVVAGQKMAREQIIEDGMIGAARHPTFSRSVK